MFRRAKAHGGSRNRSSSPWKLPHDSMKITRSSNFKNLKVTWHKSLSCSCNFWFSSCPNYDLKCVCKPEGRCIKRAFCSLHTRPQASSAVLFAALRVCVSMFLSIFNPGLHRFCPLICLRRCCQSFSELRDV